ncbi:hypothetical protein SRU_0757 [Salinibacter ruber DSM 13855]|uniref:Uncharacterized protein n=1 Tax=Salinibacter ruber (strain DSM 13855 / M31) TaxID=309807 RepID=Q2S4I7_SALRD|nr:hypothetical protein SRU_0757 [Salinibacter ruber DSM 13855]
MDVRLRGTTIRPLPLTQPARPHQRLRSALRPRRSASAAPCRIAPSRGASSGRSPPRPHRPPRPRAVPCALGPARSAVSHRPGRHSAVPLGLHGRRGAPRGPAWPRACVGRGVVAGRPVRGALGGPYPLRGVHRPHPSPLVPAHPRPARPGTGRGPTGRRTGDGQLAPDVLRVSDAGGRGRGPPHSLDSRGGPRRRVGAGPPSAGRLPRRGRRRARPAPARFGRRPAGRHGGRQFAFVPPAPASRGSLRRRGSRRVCDCPRVTSEALRLPRRPRRSPGASGEIAPPPSGFGRSAQHDVRAPGRPSGDRDFNGKLSSRPCALLYFSETAPKIEGAGFPETQPVVQEDLGRSPNADPAEHEREGCLPLNLRTLPQPPSRCP